MPDRLCPSLGPSLGSRLGPWLGPLMDLLLPVECGGCGAPGRAWCPDCELLLGPPMRVYPPCCAIGPPVHALGTYRAGLRAALLAYKERGRRDLAGPLGGALAAALLRLPPEAGGLQIPGLQIPQPGGLQIPQSGGLYLVPVPSRRSAAARRGGQHMMLLAQRAAAALSSAGVATAVAPALRMAPGVRDSVGLQRPDRQANLSGRVLPRRAGLPPTGTPVVLVDDVVTTGATAAACAAALAQTGIKVPAIVALAVAGCHDPS